MWKCVWELFYKKPVIVFVIPKCPTGSINLFLFVYILSTFCLHFVYILSTFCLHFVYILSTFCLHFVYILSTFCLHFVYILSTFCLHFVYILSTFCLHFVYILSTFCLGIAKAVLMSLYCLYILYNLVKVLIFSISLFKISIENFHISVHVISDMKFSKTNCCKQVPWIDRYVHLDWPNMAWKVPSFKRLTTHCPSRIGCEKSSYFAKFGRGNRDFVLIFAMEVVPSHFMIFLLSSYHNLIVFLS